MALKKRTKGTLGSLIGRRQGKGEKKTDSQRVNEIKNQVAEQIRRMEDIKSILQQIDFSTSELPREELERRFSPKQSLPDYELTRKMAVEYLEETEATEIDISKIDECIRYAANTFAEGVKYGQLNKAKWSMQALMYLIQYEHKDINETDREHAKDMLKKKEEHAEKFVTMLKECKKLDNREKRKAKLNKTYRKFVEDLEEKTKEFNKIMETDEGVEAMEELETNASHPISLSMTASELDAMLGIISRKDMDIILLRGELREINRQIAQIQSELDHILLALSEDAYVEDKDLLSRIEEINKERQEAMAAIVAENERMDQAIEVHQSAMAKILDSSSSAKKTVKNLMYLEKKEQEERERKQRMDAARARRQQEKEQKIKEIQKQQEEELKEKKLDKILEDLNDEVEEAYEEAYVEDTLDEVSNEAYQYNEE